MHLYDKKEKYENIVVSSITNLFKIKTANRTFISYKGIHIFYELPHYLLEFINVCSNDINHYQNPSTIKTIIYIVFYDTLNKSPLYR